MKMAIAGLLFLTQVALASEKFTPGPDNVMSAKGVLTGHVAWIKDKGGKFDLSLSLKNEEADKAIIVFLGDMGCTRGDVSGELRHTFFNTGERTIDFRPKQVKTFTLVCKLEGKAKGNFGLTIAKVYDNPSQDGKTVGKEIAHGLKWTQDDRHE